MLVASPVSSDHSSFQMFDAFDNQELDEYDFEDTLDDLICSFSANDDEQHDFRSLPISNSKDGTVPIKRRRIRKRAPKVPRLLFRDIRRNYCTMFTNAMNGYDVNLLRLFLTQYGTSQTEFKMRLYEKQSGTYSELALCSPEIITAFWAMNMQTSPDQVFSIENIGVLSRAGSRRSVAACTATLNSTIVLRADMDELVVAMAAKFGARYLIDDVRQTKRVIGGRFSRIKGKVRGSQEYFDVAQFVASKLQGDANLHSPIVMSVPMRLKFVLDDEKRIEMIVAETVIDCPIENCTDVGLATNRTLEEFKALVKYMNEEGFGIEAVKSKVGQAMEL